MKKMRRFAGLVLAMVMVMSMAVSVFAAGEYSITIENEASGHTYEAYQIFTGTLTTDENGNKILSDVAWGASVTNGASVGDAAAIAKRLETTYTGSDKLSIDALLAMIKLAKDPIKAVNTMTNNEYVINGLDAGYYLVKDKDNSLNGAHDAYTDYIVKVLGDVSMKPKSDFPSIEKKIVSDGKYFDEEGNRITNNRVDANTGSIGDTVYYELKSRVPDMDGYTKYFFIVNDTFSAGLTFDNNVAVYIGGTKIEADQYVVTLSEDGQSFKVVFKNFIQYKEQKNAEILITYSAKINKNAVIGNLGNPNVVDLTFSNNPNIIPKGEDEPTNEDKDVVGKTPEDIVITYVTGIKIFKQDENGNRLTGAEFELTGEKVNIVKVIKEEFQEVEKDGTHYLLNDETYTTDEPTPDTEDEYASTEKKYAIVTTVKWIETTQDVTAKAYVGEDGFVRFDGLGAGTYYIEEITTPDGYNSLKGKITVTITCTVPETVDAEDNTANWSYEFSFEGSDVESDTLELDRVTITNRKGATLPETGGMGTTLFYVIGATLAIGAAVVMVTRKRMSAN